MNIKTAVVLVGVGLLLGGRPVVAHHAFSAEFDAAKPVKLTGADTRPFTVTVEQQIVPDGSEMIEFICHENQMFLKMTGRAP